MIISASRRTDIPSFYTPWFFARLAQGYVLVPNPLNPTQVSRIPLSGDVVDCIVFWSKDPSPMLPRLTQLDDQGHHYYFQFTLTPYGADLEPNLRAKDAIVETFCALSQAIGKNRVVWRYDPIVLNDRWDIQRHIAAFDGLCRRLANYTDTCIISFVDGYAKNRAARREGLLRAVTPDEMIAVAASFADIAQAQHLSIQACCEPMDLSAWGVAPAHCIDSARIAQIVGQPLDLPAAQGQRPGCGCACSLDIGAYDSCLHGCHYCYATRGQNLARRNHALHDAASPFLLAEPPQYRVSARTYGSYRRKVCQQQLPLPD